MRSVNEKPCLLKKAELANANVQQVVFKPTRGCRAREVVAQGTIISKMRVIIAKSLNFWY